MSASGEVDSSQSDWVPRVRHRTLAPDSPGSVRSYTQGGLQETRAPVASTGLARERPVPYLGRV